MFVRPRKPKPNTSSAHRPSPPQLGQRPEASSFSVEELMTAVQQGRVRVPRFQRPMRWEPGDRLALFDSVYRGYPVGTLLFWKREGEAGTVRVGALAFRAAKRSDVLWVVDGQQRITTLAEGLLTELKPREKVLAFDLEEKAFVWARVSAKHELAASSHDQDSDKPRVTRTLVPASVLLDSAVLLEWLFEKKGLDAKLRAAAIDVGKRIREYEIPVYSVESDDEDVLRTIFDRVNRSGRRLSEIDVFHGLFSSEQESGATDLRTVAANLDAAGWGHIDEEQILKTAQAIEHRPGENRALDQDPSRTFARATISRTLARVEQALLIAVQFLRDAAGIPAAVFNPYALPLVVLGRFFDAFPEPHARSRILLRRWLWRGLLALRYAGARIDLRRFVECIDPADEHESVQRLLALAPDGPDPSVRDLSAPNLKHANTRVQCCALASLRPRDLGSGDVLVWRETTRASADTQEIPLLTVSKRTGEPVGLEARLLHPKLGRGASVAETLRDLDDEAVLASHAITPAAHAALVRGDMGAFLDLRRARIQEVFDEFFGRNAEWRADDSPPLHAIVTGDDE